jgi:tRNA-dihydrouridine synthase B
MKIGSIDLAPPFALAPMAGMTDTAFRRLVKRRGGCGLVVTEMVSSEGLVRGIDRTLEYAEYTEEERPVSIQIFGGDPEKMAAAAQIVEGMGADIVDVNMGCPVPKIAKHNAGCSLMREPEHAQSVIAAMTRAVRIPVTVKMRAGWDENAINAPELARRMEDAGASAIAVHGRTAAQSYSGFSDWDLIARVADGISIPVFGSGDCVEPAQLVEKLRAGGVSGVLVGRGALRNPWIFEQAAAIARGEAPREVTLADRGQFLLEYIDLLLHERTGESEGFRHVAPSRPSDAGAEVPPGPAAPASEPPRVETARGHDRWVVNKLRALNSWYTKGLDNGSHLRVAVNSAESIAQLRDIIEQFFAGASVVHDSTGATEGIGSRFFTVAN